MKRKQNDNINNKVYLAIKYHEDNSNKLLIEEISLLLKKHNYQSVCMVRDFEHWGKESFQNSHELMAATFNEINSCSALFVEATEKSVGIAIESGYAYANDIPIYIFARTGTEISPTLTGVATNVIFYSNLNELEKGLGIINE